MNILAIGAHPDDVEYGCGGMLTKYVQRGHVVFVFVASDGALGGDADVLDVKLASLEAHRSQVSKTNIEDLTILELARSCANFRGIQARVKYAEAFQSVRLLLNL